MSQMPRSLDHPSFGRCELVPSVLAIQWRAPLSAQALRAALKANVLQPATKTPEVAATRGIGARADSDRDPRPVNINNSDTLTWVTKAGVTEATLARIAEDERVQWVAPVYRARSGESGPQSWFAVNPTVLLVGEAAAAAVGDLTAFDPSSAIDTARGRFLRGFVVVSLPAGNALDVGAKVAKAAESAGIAGAIKFENLPYVSPLACGCSSATGHSLVASRACVPAGPAVAPNDTFYPNQWGLHRIDAPRAWTQSEGDAGVVVAVLDQGVQLDHPDLNLWPISYSTITHTNDGSPVGNHGTPCAGIISARIDNALGVAGLAPKCPVMAISTNFADTQVAEGLYFAADNGARVVSMSFGVYPAWMIWDFALIEAALQYCADRNVVLVAATGNENAGVSRFPGSDPRTIAVGGSNRNDVRKSIGDGSLEPFWGASFGPAIDVVAPCLEIPSTDRLAAAGYTPTDYTMRFNGTSSATPHVAALSGLILTVNSGLGREDVRRILAETADKINPLGYVYLPTAGKPFGTWHNEVGYGRINAERALLAACAAGSPGRDGGPCGVEMPVPEACCVSPCDPPWRPDAQCLIWYEDRYFRVPLKPTRAAGATAVAAIAAPGPYIEFRITYRHQLCLLGKQHGPLLHTVTLLPGEKVKLYHSDRYRRITSVQERYSVQTTFTQFLSVVHQSWVTNTLDVLSERLTSSRSGSSGGSAGGFFFGLFGFGGESSSSSSRSVTDHTEVRASTVASQFSQSVVQASQLTHAERSLVISAYEDKESLDVTSRTLENQNNCRAVTYFVRKVVELYAMSTVVSGMAYRIIAPNVPPEWHSVDDLGWLPAQVANAIRDALRLLPRVGDVVEHPRPISLPTDGAVYDAELAHCSSCDPEREAALGIRLEREKAEALKACLEAQLLEVELERRRLLLKKGELGPFEVVAPEAEPAPVP